MRVRWTNEMLDRARTMRNLGFTFREIDAALGVPKNATWNKLASLDPVKGERKREHYRNWRRKNLRPYIAGNHVAEGSIDIAPDTLAERDEALNAPRDLTATLMGDPPFHRSALARKNGASPS